MAEPGRNDPCSCGSLKKYKNCCLGKPKGASGKPIKAVALDSSSLGKMSSLFGSTFKSVEKPKENTENTPPSE